MMADNVINPEEKYCAVLEPKNIPEGYVNNVEIKGRKKSNL